ncbi:MAG TPA: lysylphosphatidylglycerol synthase domain-containing protein, partial [bacterium]|nr:lysylphosphatidylglycerol synthase domain-containing protein [bacterium]
MSSAPNNDPSRETVSGPGGGSGPRSGSEALPPEFSRRRFVAGLLLVAALAVAGFAAAVVGRGGFDALRSGVNPDPKMLGVGLLLMVVDVWLGGLRVHHLANRLCSRVTFMDGIRADLANRCLAGITPWQTGGGAAQLYVLQRAGLPLSGGVAVGTINFLISTVVLLILGFST